MGQANGAASGMNAGPYPEEMVRSGWPPGLFQDDSRAVSDALAAMPGAMRLAREAAEAIAAKRAAEEQAS